MSEEIVTEEVKTEVKMTKEQRYYALHRDEYLTKKKEAYDNRPDVIAKRAEREAKKAEKEAANAAAKEAAKAAKQAEKDKKIQERIALAEQTKRKLKKGSEQNLDPFLKSDLPA